MSRAATLAAAATAFAAGRLGDAEVAYRTILARDPDDAEVLSNLAAVLNATDRAGDAEMACRAALRRRPRYWAALANLGNALHRQQRHDEAVNAYHAALEENPRHAPAWTNLGVALNEQQRIEDSLIAHNAAVALAPQDPQIRTNRAMALLMAGELAAGFAEFEYRWRTPGMAPHGLAAPQWRGEALAGRRLLIHAEGGFGDTLQFIRYVPALEAAGATVIARVQAPLLRLLRRSFPRTAFIGADEPVPTHDVQCPMLSLPHGAGTTLATVPGAVPYLVPDAAAVAAWRKRLAAAAPGLTVGLVWAGAPLLGQAEFRAMNARRSVPVGAFAKLAEIPGVSCVSLQLGGEKAGFPLIDAMAGVTDFDDTTAIVSNVDVVISVDSAVAHLAGALGRPVWVLSRYDACWRWLAHRRDSPWYPSLRVYRQSVAGEWGGVMAEVAADLGRRAAPLLPGRRSANSMA
jgi:thioredoxin-like negative regulator of GroEL